MTVHATADLTASGDGDPSVVQPQRAPPTAVKVLMPVWGPRYVSQFLEFCVPTLLAPGNIPALARTLPCEFVLMTSASDAPAIASHPAWKYLSKICSVRLQSIDDLISDGNHTATITLAFARAVRETGDVMLDTCFLFLVSDYLFAEGSLVNVFARIRDGASAVVAGNFQINAEDAIPLLRRRLNRASIYLSLAPRELVQWSLHHLHPATVANIVNFDLNHNAHTNRLFWSVDNQTLIGRFYLMHMIAIRPEVTDFVIGSSCDYSFVPEMCPSNNVSAMTDSDEYLVVEMQPRNHERHHLRWGPIDSKKLAVSLSQWTTAQHRGNAGYTLVYHAAEVPPNLAEVAAQADAFITETNRHLSPVPHPHRYHHYWIGSIASHRLATRQAMSKQDWNFILGEQMERRGGLTRQLWRLRLSVFGSPPQVSRWHPRWLDYGLALEALQRLTPSNGRIMVVADRPIAFSAWLSNEAKDVYSLETGRLLEMPKQQFMSLVGSFDACMLFLSGGELDRNDALIGRVPPLLKPGGHAVVVAVNDRDFGEAEDFSRSFGSYASNFLNSEMTIAEVHYIPSTRWRWKVQRAIAGIGRGAMSRPKIFLPWTIAVGSFLALFSLLSNFSRRQAQSTPPRSNLCSSVLMILRTPIKQLSLRLPEFKAEKFCSAMTKLDPADTVNRHLRLRDEVGVEPLGLRTNQIWHDNPKELPALLARYRFVAKLLSQQDDVAEYGCGDAFGTRIVLQQVKKVSVYDDDPIFIEDIQRRQRVEWPLDTHVHNIMSGKLTKRHDSIYSLNAIEHISPEDEGPFVCNLRDSLNRDHDLLIIGCPTYECEALKTDAAPSSGTGSPTGEVISVPIADNDPCSDLGPTTVAPEVADLASPKPKTAAPHKQTIGPMTYLRTGADLKAMLERYFYTVLLFSLIDETVHVSVTSGAHYQFALCCGKKS